MNDIPKLKEFTIEELQEQLKDKKIDKEFLIEYIVKRDKVYNKLIDEVNKLEANRKKAIEYCNKTKEPYENHYGESFDEYDWVVDIARDLLEILKGDSNE